MNTYKTTNETQNRTRNSRWFSDTEFRDTVATDLFISTHIAKNTPYGTYVSWFFTYEGHKGFDVVITEHCSISNRLQRRNLIEVKTRNQAYADLMLEKHKFDSMFDKATSRDRCFYLNFLPGGKAVLFNLTAINSKQDIEWSKQNLPAHSAGSANWRNKEQTKLPVSWGTVYDFDSVAAFEENQDKPLTGLAIPKAALDAIDVFHRTAPPKTGGNAG